MILANKAATAQRRRIGPKLIRIEDKARKTKALVNSLDSIIPSQFYHIFLFLVYLMFFQMLIQYLSSSFFLKAIFMFIIYAFQKPADIIIIIIFIINKNSTGENC